MVERGPPNAGQLRHQQLVDKLEHGFQRVQESDEFRRYLDTVSRFREYSVTNTMLIWMQYPEATLVAGFRTWLSLGRHVRKGESGIRIFAPMQLRQKPEPTNESEDGAEANVLRFRPVTVFDVSQTEGADLPEPPVTRLSGSQTDLWHDLVTIARSQALTVDRGMNIGSERPNGFYNRSQRLIWVDPDLPPVMASKTLCHEIAHHFSEGSETRQESETIAESVAYVVLGHFGIDAADYSFGYLAGWSDLATFKAKVTAIKQIASRIIDSITERRLTSEGDVGAGLPVPGHGDGEAWVGAR